MASFGSRRGEAGSLTVYLMVGAFLVAGGFFFWLSIQAAPTEVVVVEGDEPVEQDMGAVVDAADFGMDPLAHAGMVIELHRLGVGTLLGAEAFMLNGIPNQSSGYLVKMSPGVVPIGGELLSGATVTVTGTVYAMADSLADAWVVSGGIEESNRLIAQFALSFIEVRAVSVTAPPQPDP